MGREITGGSKKILYMRSPLDIMNAIDKYKEVSAFLDLKHRDAERLRFL